jgi:molybdopterin-dependent oxidoreductase alpha subunit
MVFRGTDLADTFLQIKLGGDQALFQALGKVLVELDASRGDVLDHDFLAHYTQGFEAYRDAVAALPWAEVETATGLTEKQIRKVAELMAASKGNIVCWAMGLTQHKHSVAMLRDVVNLLLLRGDIGKPGAGLCPVRGHSNVQGDRTMGIWEQMPDAFHDKLDAEFGFSSPREHGVDTVGAIRGMRDGTIKVFLGMGGNFAKATPDTAVTEAAMRSLRLTVQVSTKLNRSHVVTGRRALILPTLGRTERDVQATGRQTVTVEDSMSMVHESQGNLEPASRHLRSEVAIVAGLAERVLRGRTDTAHVDWRGLAGDYRRIRTHIEHVIPGFDAYEEKLGMPGGFVLPHGPRDHRSFDTDTGKAKFTVNDLAYPKVPEGRLILQTIRAHDQYNTTIYGKDDRYRGIHGGRKVVLVNAKDLAARGLADGDLVDLVSEAPDGERRAEGWRAVAYRTPAGCAAAYYPETNVLVPLDSVADTSNTPTSKSIVVRLEKARVPVPA